MADETLYCVKVLDQSENPDLVPELLPGLELDFNSYFDRESGKTTYTLYAQSREGADDAEAVLRRAEKEWSDFGVKFTDYERFELAKSEWADAWKKFFRPIELSSKLLIRPSWLDDEPKPGQKVLTLDPGMSFGTGQHATTFFCLQQIDRLAREAHSLLDAGCGSGILAIAGALLGYSVIDAFDFDPDAVRVAKENMALNGVSNFTPTVGDAANYPGREGGYDLVCANILGHLLRAYRHNIIRWVRPGGHLALAGILTEQFDALSADFVSLGLREESRTTLREWTSGIFVKNME